jgi:hypothetical protein
MKRIHLLALGGLAAVLAPLAIRSAVGGPSIQSPAIAPLPKEPALAPVELVAAQPFVLDEPFTHYWRKEQPDVRSGYLLVLHADPDLIRPRQTFEPVLYVGEQTAERCNTGAVSGHLVCVVPAETDASGRVLLDPTKVPIWFGAPDLPERIDGQAIRTALAQARTKGVGPVRVAQTMRAFASASTLHARDRSELELAIADLIEVYSPTEEALVEGLRVPVTR